MGQCARCFSCMTIRSKIEEGKENRHSDANTGLQHGDVIRTEPTLKLLLTI